MKKNPRSRGYSAKTLKVLFARSGDQCTVPDCQNPTIQPTDEEYDDQVLGQICHIYARNPAGPRGDGGLQDDELNSESNLILLCANHHQEIDKYPEKYPANRLKSMKREHWRNVRKRMIKPSEEPSLLYAPAATSIIDQEITKNLQVLSTCQFYPEFDLEYMTNLLAAKIISGEYRGGSEHARSVALNHCARYISISSAESKIATNYLDRARELSDKLSTAVTESYLSPTTSLDSEILKPILRSRTPTTLSAILRLIKVRFGADVAVNWLTTTGLGVHDFDAIGKLVLLKSYFDLEDWDAALKTMRSIGSDDIDSLPILNHLVGLAYLLLAVPDELKSPVLLTVPINASSFPIAADEDSVTSMSHAMEHFDSAASSARKLGCLNSAQLSCQYALWLKLLLPKTRATTLENLAARFSTGAVPLHLVSLALEFGIQINANEVERQLEREIALTGMVSLEATTARFALARLRNSPDEFVDYIDSYYDTLATHMQPKFLRFNQIFVLAAHEEKRRALEYLEELLASSIEVSETEEAYLRSLIEGGDTAESTHIELDQYKETNSLSDLRLVVYALQENRRWDDLRYYARCLFDRTRSKEDAEILAQALRNSNRSAELRDFLQSQSFIVKESWHLRLLYCWSLLEEGQLRKARRSFLELERRDADPNYRELEVLTCVITGHWESLLQFLENELRCSAERDAHELLKAASLAEDLGSPHARGLIRAAAASGSSDPEILAGAFQLATRGGWEADDGPAEWINRARQLSDERGPIKSIDLDELISQVPKWQQQRSNINDLISQAQIPMSAGAEALHQSLSDFILVPAYSNLGVNSADQITAIPIYSGASTAKTFSNSSAIGFDLTSLLVLEFLDVLPTVFSSFDSIFLPPRIIEVLLWERSLAKFHQPSRVANGRNLQHLVVSNKLTVLAPSSTVDSDLASEVGDELAILIAEAERVPVQSAGHRMVVRPGPVQKVWVDDRSIVDLTSHGGVLCSCRAVVTNLRDRGYLTATEFASATSYLNKQEEDWTDQPDISDGAELFLDSLAVSYFLHLDLMEKVCLAGFRVFVSRQLMSEFNSITIRAEMLSKVRSSIDNIRHHIVTGIDQGKVKVGRDVEHTGWSRQLKSLQTIEGLISMATDCDVIVCDDRFFNQREFFSNNADRVPIISTISIIESLRAHSVIRESDRLSLYTKLRRSGFSFVPVDTTELSTYLSSMSLVNNREVEPAELRAIRVSLLLARLSNAFNAENEFRWLDGVFEVLIRVVRAEWVRGGAVSDLRCRANWISKQLDMRGWAHKLEGRNALEVSRLLYLGFIPILFVRPARLRTDLVDEYWNWVEETLLFEIKLKAPSVYEELVKQHRSQIHTMVEEQFDELRDRFGDDPNLRSEIARVALEYSPPLIRQSLFRDEEYLALYGSSIHPVMLLHPGPVSMRRDYLLSAARRALKEATPVEVDDSAGNAWTLEITFHDADVPVFAVRRGSDYIRVPTLFGLSEDREVRVSGFRHAANQTGLPIEVRKSWDARLGDCSLTDSEMVELLQEFRDTVGYVSTVIAMEFKKDHVQIEALVPESVRYYERLVGSYRGESDISEYAARSGGQFLRHLTRDKTRESIMSALVVGSHPQLTQQISVEGCSKSTLEAVLSDIRRSGDRLSQIAAVEVGLRIVIEHPWIEETLESLVRILKNDDGSGTDSGFAVQSALFALVDAELSRRCILTGVPPFYRRLAALAHSSIIHRHIVNSSIDSRSFCEYVEARFLARFQIQSLVDMRLEPRWESTFCSPMYLRTEFLSRAVLAASALSDPIASSSLRSLLLGDDTDSLRSEIDFPSWYFAGPLEGSLALKVELGSDLVSVICEQLSSANVGPRSFVALINSAFIGPVRATQADLASETLSRGRYRLSGVEDKSQLLSVLFGLARVSAHSRSSNLAQALRYVSHNYRYDREFPLSTDEELRIMLMAGASFGELQEWCEFVGEWLVELALGTSVQSESREHLYLSVRILTGLVPELWMSCGSADAALSTEYESQSH